MLRCSVVPRALGTHGVPVTAQHPGAPGSGGSGGRKQTGGAGCVYVCAFAQHIDGRVFLLLTQTDIAQVMKIELGPAVKVYNSILMFRRSQDLAGEDAISGQEAMGGCCT